MSSAALRSRRHISSTVERTLRDLSRKMERALLAEKIAKQHGFLQTLDPRVKVVGLLALIIDVAVASNITTLLGIFAVALLLAWLSHVPLGLLARRVWIGALVFTGLIALPAIFITPGIVIYRLAFLDWPITIQGLRSAIYLIIRVETASTLAILLTTCTLWTHVLKALRVLHVPVIFIIILGMTHRYIFLLAATVRNMLEARQSRSVGVLDARERRRLAAGSVAVLLNRSVDLSSEVYLAMQSRGFHGEVYVLEDFKFQTRDWAAMAGFILLAAFAFWRGR